MKIFSQKKVFGCAVAGVLLCGAVVFSGCDDSSSAGGDNGSGGNRGGIPDTVETFMELSDYDCGKSQKCVATYLTEYHDMAVCDGNNGWVIGTLIEKMDCDFSASSVNSSDSRDDDGFSSSHSGDGTPESSADDDDVSSGSKKGNSSGSEKSRSSSAESSSSLSIFDVSKISYGEITDERDGQKYKTAKMGDQVWMAENLNFAYTGVPYNVNDREIDDSTSWCYGRKLENCATYGRLYTWATAIDSIALENDASNSQICGFKKKCTLPTVVQGICPEGWHLPTMEEWKTLINAFGGSKTAGKYLFSDGFSALPAGEKYEGSFTEMGRVAYFWSASEWGDYQAYNMELHHDIHWQDNIQIHDFKIFILDGRKYNGFSVRCLKDSE